MAIAADGKAASARFSGAMVALLALAIFINYVDRGNLATAAPLLKKELKLDATHYGWLVSAFSWVYVLGQPGASWVIGRFGAYRALAVGVVVWSAATLLSGFATSFAMLLALRVLLGLGESAGFPASSALLSRHLPRHRLGGANGLISTGLMLGPAAGTFFGGLLMAHAGWRVLFIAFGLVSLTWLIPWLVVTRHASAHDRQQTDVAGPSHWQILSRRELWGASLGHFAANYPFYLVLNWLPLYLVTARHFSISQMAGISGLAYVMSAATALLGGRLADRWMASGASSNRVRKTMVVGVGAIAVVSMLACAFGGPQVAIGGIFLACIPNGVASFNVFAIGQTLAGPAATAKWIGWQNGLGNISGIVAPLITGAIIDATGHFELAFLAAAGVAAVGIVSWLTIVPRIEPLSWPADAGAADAAS